MVCRAAALARPAAQTVVLIENFAVEVSSRVMHDRSPLHARAYGARQVTPTVAKAATTSASL